MSSWSDEGRVMPAYVAGDATLEEVTPQPGKGTLGHGGRGKCVHAFRTLSRGICCGAYVPSSETNRGGDGWMLVRTLACARTGGLLGQSWSPTGTWEIRLTGMTTEACGIVCATGAELRPLGKSRESPSDPTAHARRISIQTTCDSYVPKVVGRGTNPLRGECRRDGDDSAYRAS